MTSQAVCVPARLVIGNQQPLLAPLPEHVALRPLATATNNSVDVDDDWRPASRGQLGGECSPPALELVDPAFRSQAAGA